MDITVCQICFKRYSNSNIPMILNCGHTYCNICTERCSRCPSCREDITSKTKNILLAQASSRSSSTCRHSEKSLYCPVCTFGLCLNCIIHHNMHGVVPISEPGVEGLVNSRLTNASKRIGQVRNSISKELQKISEMHQQINMRMSEVVFEVKEKLNAIRDKITTKEKELIDQIYADYKPLTSRLEAISIEFENALSINQQEEGYIEQLLEMKLEEKINGIRGFNIKHVSSNILQFIEKKYQSLPEMYLETSKIDKSIDIFGQTNIPFHKKIAIF